MDTKMGGIIAPAQKLGAIGTTSVLPKPGQQSLASRVLGGSDGRRFGGGGGGGRFAGEGRGIRATGDESELGRKILATHHEAEERIQVTPILNIIDVIFHRAIADFPGFIQGERTLSEIAATDEKVLRSSVALQDMVDLPTRVISNISCEVSCKCTTGVDVHTIVMEILQIVKHYNWDSKVVLALVSFAVVFGEFRLLFQLYSTNPLAKAVALLKQLPEVMEHLGALKPKLDALFALMDEIVDVTNKIVEFYELPGRNEYFAADSAEIVAANSHIPTAVYWTIRSIVVSTTQILALTGMGIEYLTEQWELSSLAHKLKNIKGHIVDIIQRCNEFIKSQREKEMLETIKKIFKTAHIDNQVPLSTLFHYMDGQPALYDCYSKRRVSIDELRRKVVALFITDIDPLLSRGQEYAVLQQMYIEKRQNQSRTESQYEVVWVPIVDFWSDEKYRQFETLRDQMEWYSVHHPSVVSSVVVRFIKEQWNFTKKPILVVMDTQGKIVHQNAIHMMCIWGSIAYPFTNNKEKLLWEDVTWSLDLIADNLEPNMALWLQEGRHICLYGGEDIEWIRKFTRIAKDVAMESGITLELLYVGRRTTKERLTRNIIETIHAENLSRTLDPSIIWYFWMRLESMWQSKGQFTKSENVKNDPILQGIIALLSYDQWALFSKGYTEMAKANGEHMHKALAEHSRWRTRVNEIGFVPALDEYLHQIHIEAPHHCTSLLLPATGAMPDSVSCSECGRLMERFTMFRCCLD